MSPGEESEVCYGRESWRALVGIFAVSTLIGMAAGYGLAPEGISTLRMVLGGGVLGFHSAMYPFANRYLMM